MATRIDHSNCTHPRTPAGRAECRRATYYRADMGIPDDPRCLGASDNRGVIKPSREERMLETAHANMKKANRKVRVITDPSQLPMPKLTPAQLASPIFQSLMRHRKV